MICSVSKVEPFNYNFNNKNLIERVNAFRRASQMARGCLPRGVHIISGVSVSVEERNTVDI